MFLADQGTDTTKETFKCGSLVYTKAGLFVLFSWLLWGDFCFSLMETVWPNVVPLMLKGEGASNILLSVVMTTIPSAMNFVLNPVISTASDRYRGRRGRRVPFLLGATPFVALFLACLGFSREIGRFLHFLVGSAFPNLSTSAFTIGTICIFVVCFRFFELFISTVFWYLFNDVVPPEFMGRFVGLFRVIGSLAGALFNLFLYKYAASHSPIILFSVAVLYGSAFISLSLKIREGKYPPPDAIERVSLFFRVQTFLYECLCHRLYRRVFVYSGILGLGSAVNTFAVFMALSIGLSLEEFGEITGVAAIIGMLFMYPMGTMIDRFHPIRVMMIAQAGFCLVTAVKLVFLFHEFSKPVTFWLYAGATALAIPINVANSAAALPLVMRLFPQAKFGQFCAANAMCTAAGVIVGGILAGLSLDLLKSFTPIGEFVYRFVPVWSIIFMTIALVAMRYVFKEWKSLGGDASFRPPIADSFEGR